MWSALKKHFKGFPAQQKVARLMIEYGLSVRSGKVLCADIEVPALRIGKALGIDRRVVNATIKTIESNKELKGVFENLKPIAFFRDIVKPMGWSIVEIIPEDPAMPGILAGVSRIIADEGISIRQAITEDPEFSDNAGLFIICEEHVPSSVVGKIRHVAGVKSVVIS